MAEKIDPSKRRFASRPIPLGITERTPMALIAYKEIDPLLEPLGPASAKRLKLRADIRKIMALYLGQKMSADRKKDHAASLKALVPIANQASALAKHLAEIDPDFLVVLDNLRAEVPDLGQWSRSYFEFLPLIDHLHDLARVAAIAETKIKPNARKRPVRIHLERAVGDLSDAIEKATGQAPRRSRSRGSVPTRRLVGKESAFLLSLFKHFDPSVSAQMLAAILEKRRVGKLTVSGKRPTV